MTCYLVIAVAFVLGAIMVLVLAGLGWASEMDEKAQQLSKEREEKL